MTDDRPKGREALNEIGARLGELVGHVRAAFDDISKATNTDEHRSSDDSSFSNEGDRDLTIDTPKGPLTARAGWRVRVGGILGDENGHQSNDFSSDPVKRSSNASSASATARDCNAEIYDEATCWIMTAETPGVSDKEVSLSIADGVLSFQTTGARRYQYRATLPSSADASAMEWRLTNGILEVRLPKN